MAMAESCGANCAGTRTKLGVMPTSTFVQPVTESPARSNRHGNWLTITLTVRTRHFSLTLYVKVRPCALRSTTGCSFRLTPHIVEFWYCTLETTLQPPCFPRTTKQSILNSEKAEPADPSNF